MKIRFHAMLGESHSWCYTQHALIRAILKISDHEVFTKSTDNLEYYPDDLRHLLLPGYHGHLVQGPADYVDEQGNQIKVDPKSPLPNIIDKNKPYDIDLAYTIFMQSPRRFYPDSKLKLIIWNFESTIMPPGWQEYHRAIDYYLPSSQFSYDIFAMNGVPKDKMIIVPHGIDTNLFHPNIPPFKLKTEKKVKFLHNAIPHYRKCHDRMLKAYLDAFTGNDDVCLVMKTKFLTPDPKKPFEVDVKKVLDEAFKGRKNPPEVEIVNEIIPDIGALYTACDAVVSMSSTEGFCLLPETQIDTNCGLKKINEINKEMSVISHNGKERNILKIISHGIKEKIYKIHRMGHFERICGTGNHPLLTVIKKYKNSTKKIAKWVGMKDLQTGDFLVIPIPKDKMHNITTFNISKCINDNNLKIDENGYIYYKSSFRKNYNASYNKIAEITNSTKNIVKNILLNNCRPNTQLNQKVKEVANNLGWYKPKLAKCQNKLIMDKYIAEYFGLYISEGCDDTRNNAIIFSSHKDEEYARILEKTISNKLFNCTIRENIINNTGIVTISTRIGSKFLSSFFGSHAKIKTIPRILWGNKYVNYIIRGIFYGDGCVNNNSYQFSTASKKLADDLYQICLRNGILLYTTHLKGKYPSYILTVARQHHDKFFNWICPIKYNKVVKLSSSKSTRHTFFEGENCFLVPILSKEEFDYEGKVYNLEVDIDKSYTINGVASHNCLPLLESLACEKLVISPRYGGALDFLNDNNSILIDTGEMHAPKTMQYWHYDKNAIVGDPSVKHCSELLRRVYENLEEETQRVIKPAQETVKKFSWENAAQMILDIPVPEKSSRLVEAEKKKVLYIVPYSIVGGAEVWLKQTIKQLDGFEPHIAFVNGYTEEAKNIFGDLDATIEDLSDKGKYHGLRCMLESGTYSIVHFYNSFAIYQLLRSIWNQGFRSRIIETVHSELKWHDSMTKVSTRDKMVALMISVSETLGRKMLKLGNKNVAILPQQVDWNRFKVDRSKKILEEFHIPKNFVVGFVGRLSPEKNIQTILQCARSMPEASFVIIGDGPQKAPLAQIGSKLHNVFFLGSKNNVEQFYPAFDALILTSSMEGLPLVALEAMTSGTPVVAPNVGAIPEVVKHGINGFIVDKHNDYLLYTTFLSKLKDEKMWIECSKNSRIIAKSLEERSKSFNINNLYKLMFKK